MKADSRRSFGALLRRFRKTAKKTLENLADELGVSVVYVSDVERGNRSPFRAELIEKAATFLDADARALLRAAAEVRGSFEVDADHVPQAAREFVVGLARGEHYPDSFWEEVMQLAQRHKEPEK
jgi:transcriptional regulator with XRE-family HTH domain